MRLFLLLVLSLLLSTAQAATTLVLESDPGDPIGQGKSSTTNSGVIEYVGGNALVVNAADLKLSFASTLSHSMKAGTYHTLSRMSGENDPGMSVLPAGVTDCPTYFKGDFDVYEYDTDATDGPVIAIDFVQYCGSSTAALRGSLRVNSTVPTGIFGKPFVAINGRRSMQEGRSISLSGERSFSGRGDIVSYVWAQVSGKTAIIATPNAAKTSVTLPTGLALGGEALQFELTVKDSANQVSKAIHAIHVSSKSDQFTFLEMHSAVGDAIGQGKDWYYDLSDANFLFDETYLGGGGISGFVNASGSSWELGFADVDTGTLEEGKTYTHVMAKDGYRPGFAGLKVFAADRSCSTLTGAFTVSNLDNVWSDSTRSLMIDFKQYCNGSSALLTGTLAVNTRHSSVPVAEAGVDMDVNEKAVVNLNGSASSDTMGQIKTWAWSTDSPGITIQNSNQSRAYFSAPALNDNELLRLVRARLLVTDDEGYQSEDWVNIHIRSNNLAPEAKEDEVVLQQGETTFAVLDNDRDQDGSLRADTIEVAMYPMHGNVIVHQDGKLTYIPTGSTPMNDFFSYTVRDNDGTYSNTASVALYASTGTGLSLKMRALLQGPYDMPSGLMWDNLIRKKVLPTRQPYGAWGYNGADTLASGLENAQYDAAPVDWVLVELRDSAQPDKILAQRAFMLQRDGEVVDKADNKILRIPGLAAGSYYVALRHRNHTGVMTANPVALTEVALQMIDFSATSTATRPENARLVNSDGTALLWAGDINADGRIIANGPGTDSNAVLIKVLSDPANLTASTNFIASGYAGSDLNLDGKTLYAGPGNDASLILQNVLLHPGNTAGLANYLIEGGLK